MIDEIRRAWRDSARAALTEAVAYCLYGGAATLCGSWVTAGEAYGKARQAAIRAAKNYHAILVTRR